MENITDNGLYSDTFYAVNMFLIEKYKILSVKRTFNNIDSRSIRQGQFTKFKCTDGSMVMINDVNVLCIEVFSEENKK